MTTPFSGNAVTHIYNVVNVVPDPPSARRPSVPRDLERICLKMLSKRVPDRYASCEEAAADLNRWLSDIPVLARRAPLGERFVRWCVRAPLVSALTAGLFLSVATGLLVSLIALRRAQAARTHADEMLEAANTERRRADERTDEAEQALRDLKIEQDKRQVATELAAAQEALAKERLEASLKATEELLQAKQDVADARMRENAASERLTTSEQTRLNDELGRKKDEYWLQVASAYAVSATENRKPQLTQGAAPQDPALGTCWETAFAVEGRIISFDPMAELEQNGVRPTIAHVAYSDNLQQVVFIAQSNAGTSIFLLPLFSTSVPRATLGLAVPFQAKTIPRFGPLPAGELQRINARMASMESDRAFFSQSGNLASIAQQHTDGMLSRFLYAEIGGKGKQYAGTFRPSPMLFDEQRGLEFRSHHDGGTPSLLLDPFDGPRKTIAIRDSAFYPIFACDDGALLVCPDGIVEVRSGKCLAKILIHSGRPYDQRAQNKVAVDDRCRMFAICDSNAVVVWKLEGSGETLTCSAVSTIPCDTNDIHALRLSPDGTRLFVLCKSGVVRLMRTDKAAPPLVIRRSEAGFAGMDISADGRYLVTVDAAGKIEGLDAGRSLTPTAP